MAAFQVFFYGRFWVFTEVMEWYDGLDREQVKAVIEFAARSLDKAPACAS